MVRQSFDVFNTFGKNAAQFENILFGFVKVLEPYDIAAINKSFERWLRGNSVMPTPADIAKECAEIYACRPRPAAPKALPAPVTIAKAVPWYGKSWDQLDDRLKQQLREHCRNLGNKFEDYSKYLINTMGYPQGFMG